MDYLARFIIDRIKCRFHPYIPLGEGWRSYPPHMVKALEYLEPLHIIAITPTWVGMDGVYIDDTRGMHDKYSIALETVEAIFGETVEEKGGGNLELAALSTGLWTLKFFQGSIWYIAVCSDVQPYPARFAFLADQLIPCAKNRHASRNGEVVCVVATADCAKVGFLASEKFFREPNAENVEFFGDLLFLTQMRDGWVIDKDIEVSVGCEWNIDPYKCIALVLKDCPGLKSFLSHAHIELVLNDPQSQSCQKWSSLVRAVEKALEKDL